MVSWTDPALVKITLLELTLMVERYYVTQCEGRLKNGTRVWVFLPFKHLPRYGFRKVLIRHARAANVNVKRLGILEAII